MDSSRPFATRTSAAAPPLRKRRSFWAVIATVMALLVAGLSAPAAFALSVTSAVFSGGTGTAIVGGVVYAKGGTSLTLTVTTSNDTRCVKVSGAFDAILTSADARTSWVFPTSAASAEGVQAVTVAASAAHNDNDKNPNCTGNSVTTQASYTADNTGPVVTGAVSPRRTPPAGTRRTPPSPGPRWMPLPECSAVPPLLRKPSLPTASPLSLRPRPTA